MKAAWCLALLVACGSDPGPHDVVKCATGFGTCEQACNTITRHFVADCIGTHDGNVHACTGNAFDYDGLTGCCAPPTAAEMSDVIIEFYVCP